MVVREAINKPTGTLHEGDVISITKLEDLRHHISDLGGIENLVNLQCLALPMGEISDISPLKGLSKLCYINLSYNKISNLTPLKGLHKLDMLNLKNNQVSDISALQSLANLTSLDLRSNQVNGENQQILKKALSKCRITY